MFFHHQEEVKPVYVKQMVDVWQCPDCIGWMQKEFTVSANPVCPFCTSAMIEGTKEINVLEQNC
ncbi:ABC-type ATPase with predicted acetyltransferase domain [Anaerosolibacter carboniphilus]|uniref:ABC-type ATPase with predicted acetyltransferase domain n=1 Tax=Anaerosolibacter carboniphilus TaxID=1417629 RepID=A0A841KTH9_9FIRM|nr:cold-inducible protein YdjO-related protein [Anaerosolibacter carboniphilus]MBB6216721.1 ABC-type ATPase with predicted acetyltransferase domain [Anaerosolibacter carboniphilus]